MQHVWIYIHLQVLELLYQKDLTLSICISYEILKSDLAPTSVSDLLKEYEYHHTSINGKICSDMVKALPAVLKMYPQGNVIWKDDALIHCYPEALDQIPKDHKQAFKIGIFDVIFYKNHLKQGTFKNQKLTYNR